MKTARRLFARISRAFGVSVNVRHNGPALDRVITPRLPSYGFAISPISGRAKVWLGQGVTREFDTPAEALAFVASLGATAHNIGRVATVESGRLVVRSALAFA